MVQNLRAYFTLLCYHNQIYKIYTGKDWIFLHVKKTKVDRNHNFRSLLGYNGKATVKNCKKILRGGKRMASCCPGVSFATPSLRACNAIVRNISEPIGGDPISTPYRNLQRLGT